MQLADAAFSKSTPERYGAFGRSSEDLLLDLYACPGEPERWRFMLDHLCAATGARSAVLQSFSLAQESLIQRWSVEDSRTQNEVSPRGRNLASSKSNPRLEAKRGLVGLNRLVRDEDLFPHEDLALRDFRERLRALGLGRFIGTIWQVEHDTYASIALHRDPGDSGDFSSWQIDRLNSLSPHLRQATRLSIKLDEAHGLDYQLRRQFDHLRCGMVVCDGNGQVRWLNGSAERLLDGDYALRLRAGALLGRKASDTERLLGQVGLAATCGGKASYLALGNAPGILHLVVQPLAQLGMSGADNSVLLIMSTPETGMPVSSEALKVLFGLTSAESNLVCGLVDGLSLDQYASRRQVSTGTVRGQLKQVLAKTGASRQSELVRLVLSSAAAQVRATD